MKLREPRVEIPPSSYFSDMLKLFHPLMFAPILMLVTIGTFLAPQLDPIRYILELIGVSTLVIAIYHFDEAIEKVTAPSVPHHHNLMIYFIGVFIAIVIAIYLLTTVSVILIIPVLIALVLGIGYNLDIKFFKNRFYYSLVWGGTPIFGSYMLQTGTWPNLTVIVFTIFGMLLSVKLFWNWSLRCCGRYAVCSKNCQIITFPSTPGYVPDGENRYCHSPNTMKCLDRLQVPREVNSTMKVLQKLDLLILFAIMWGVILL